MTEAEDSVRRRLFAALEHERRVNLHQDEIHVVFADGVATVSGQVADVAAKRLTLARLAALPEVSGIVDRLHTRAAAPMGDGEIADHVQRSVLDEPVFNACSIRRHVRDEQTVVRQADDDRYAWSIEVRVADGIVTLDGEVPSLTHKRLAGVLAWWVPGSRDVINGLGVEPDERDSDDEILDALRIVLEKDRFVDAVQIDADCKDAVITLRGLVGSDAEKDLAEADAWALFAVDDVVNELRVMTR